MTINPGHDTSDPDVTVGLPVYNGAATVARAIDAILGQTHQKLVLLISDNASTDATPAICESIAAQDARVKFIRHDQNQGALQNFRFVLDQARTPFFMWAAHDDWLDSDTIAQCRRALLHHDNACAALPETLIHANASSTRQARGAASIGGPVAIRLARFLMRPADNSRYYGLFRTEMLRNSFPANLADVPGADWVVSALTLVSGAHISVPGARLHRSAAEQGRYARHLRSRTVPNIDRLIPTASMSWQLLHQLSWPLALMALPPLLLLGTHQALWLRWVNWKVSRQRRQ